MEITSKTFWSLFWHKIYRYLRNNDYEICTYLVFKFETKINSFERINIVPSHYNVITIK